VDIIISAVMITVYAIYLWILIKDQKNDSSENRNIERTPINRKNYFVGSFRYNGTYTGMSVVGLFFT